MTLQARKELSFRDRRKRFHRNIDGLGLESAGYLAVTRKEAAAEEIVKHGIRAGRTVVRHNQRPGSHGFTVIFPAEIGGTPY